MKGAFQRRQGEARRRVIAYFRRGEATLERHAMATERRKATWCGDAIGVAFFILFLRRSSSPQILRFFAIAAPSWRLLLRELQSRLLLLLSHAKEISPKFVQFLSHFCRLLDYAVPYLQICVYYLKAYPNRLWAISPLCKPELHPEIYNLNQQKEATVAEVKDNQGWNLSFRRRLNDCEIDKLADFYKCLEQANNLDTKEDSLQWLRANNGKFTIKSTYRRLDRLVEMLLPWPWKMIWKIKVTRRDGKMEDCLGLHLVDNLEGKELEMLRKQEHPSPEFEVELSYNLMKMKMLELKQVIWSFEVQVKAQINDSGVSPSFEDGMHGEKWKKNNIGTFCPCATRLFSLAEQSSP
ncbi:hypothetical protein H5410_037450 [Solanum commersonii]|uniref:Uncharacterized protein n=1 Tax=Solanum commersonii TaxID=4109 RepID=A0A9J5Y825_SOLCO|nr:hypothetical protein H5410_037450 [Solanum commersonii]